MPITTRILYVSIGLCLSLGACGDEGADGEGTGSGEEGEAGDGDGDGDGDGECGAPASSPGPTFTAEDWPQEPFESFQSEDVSCVVTGSDPTMLGLECTLESNPYAITFQATPLPTLPAQTAVTLDLYCSADQGGDADFPRPRAECTHWAAVVSDADGAQAVIVSHAVIPAALDASPLTLELSKPCGDTEFAEDDLPAAVKITGDEAISLRALEAGEVAASDLEFVAEVQEATLLSCCHFPADLRFAVARK